MARDRELAPSFWDRSRRQKVLVVIALVTVAVMVLPFLPVLFA